MVIIKIKFICLYKEVDAESELMNILQQVFYNIFIIVFLAGLILCLHKENNICLRLKPESVLCVLEFTVFRL